MFTSIRYGSSFRCDEFILLLPEISKLEDAGTLAKKLLNTVRPPV